jgi:hypothetical protein
MNYINAFFIPQDLYNANFRFSKSNFTIFDFVLNRPILAIKIYSDESNKPQRKCAE